MTSAGGPHKVQWGYDANPALGTSSFYDQTRVQIVHKLPGGWHTFWVKADCGSSQVRFKLGN